MEVRSLNSNKGKIAIGEIALLIFSIVAFAYVLEGSFGVVGASNDETHKYTVKRGDTLSAIALRLRVNQDDLVRKNNLNDPERVPEKLRSTYKNPLDYLPAGTTLMIPGEQAEEQVRKGTASAGRFGTSGRGWWKTDLNTWGILQDAGAAASIYAGTRWLLGSTGLGDEFVSAASNSAAGAFFSMKVLNNAGAFGKRGFLSKLWAPLGTGWGTFGVGLGIAAVIFVATFKKTKYELYSFTCEPWSAPKGGENCEICNEGDIPCTEYRCKSLGQACELVNKGTTEELCVWADRSTEPAVIEPWTNALTTGYKYTPDNTISPPDRGVKIVPEDPNKKCIKPFELVTFGIALDKPAECKIDSRNTGGFDKMRWSFSGGLTRYNHSSGVVYPSAEALASGNLTYETGETNYFYVRCDDVNGNQNEANFVFSFCVDDSPDTSAPVIVTTSTANGKPISSGQSSYDLDIYVNEPSECRWSKSDLDYDNMEEQMICETDPISLNAQGTYKCSTTLTGLKDRQNNDFYFRCKDKPWLAGTDEESDRNVDATSCIYKDSDACKFTLIGTQPLVISDVGPDNETITDSTDIVKVTLEAETTAGFNKGDATCSYSPSGKSGSYIEFYNTGSHSHSQDLHLIEGDYTYHIRCTDAGGNTDDEVVGFTVDTDTRAPRAVRAFKDGENLKIITDEEALCVYDGVSCTYEFDLGTEMNTDFGELSKTHSIAWEANKNFYIKCEDEFENRPDPDECSIVVRPYEV